MVRLHRKPWSARRHPETAAAQALPHPRLAKALGGAGAEATEAEHWDNVAAKLLQTFAKQVHTTAFGSLKPG